jgi:hypothetical protein
MASYHFETTTTTSAAAAPNVEHNSSAAATAASLPNDVVVTSSYISYEHSLAATEWPPLDNGRPIPARMYFTNIEMSEGGTVFRSTIDWMGTHHTTWANTTCGSYRYEIRFDSKFQCVVGGAIRCRGPFSSEHNNSGHDDNDDGVPPQQQQQQQQDVVLSEFGSVNLVYINAAVYSHADDTVPAAETTTMTRQQQRQQ